MRPDNIPAELRAIPQWVVAGEDKNPLNPRTGQPASVTNSATWGTFEEAKQAGYRHVGFVLSTNDPYAIIDLDAPLTDEQRNRHQKIFENTFSYSEISQSGKGVHIVVRGKLPHGVRRDRVEVYADSRYMIFTGDVINNAPISDQQAILDMMFAEMGSTVEADLDEQPPTVGDAELYDIAAGAANAEKFAKLFAGDFSDYPSQSEADFALLSIIAFYTRSNEQVRRVFRYSQLGKREKAVCNDVYVNRCLRRIRGRQAAAGQLLDPIDLTAILNTPVTAETQMVLPLTNAAWEFTPPAPLPITIAPACPPPAPLPNANSIYPPGLLGEMAEYIYSSAIRPVREISLVASLALGAGVFGRHFNISGTGLNQYIVLLARTGAGKEGMSGGIDAMIASIRSQLPVADEFIGPATFASGQALTRVVSKQPCFVSVLGELGLTLQQVCDKNAGPHHLQLRKVLLDLYTKSGWHKVLQPSVYSDSERNTEAVRAPAVTILGESTPESFFPALDSGHIAEGLIPRFLIVEYTGFRPPMNHQAFHAPNAALQHRFLNACQTVLTMRANMTCCPVQTDRFALSMFNEFNSEADDKINGSSDDVIVHLWNRAHLKVLRLSALIAVGCNHQQPIITKEIGEWAINLVSGDIANMTARFSSGDVGQGDHKQAAEIVKAFDRWSTLTSAQRSQYKVPVSLLEREQLVPYAYLRRYLGARKAFKDDKKGSIVAIKVVLDDLVKSGVVAMVPVVQAKTELGVDSPVYYRGQSW